MKAYLATTSYSFKVKVAASQNENSRHATHLGTDIGEPDLRLSARAGGVYYMYYLELKTTKGRLRESQTEWADDFNQNFACNNASCDVAYGFQEAKDKIIAWIDFVSHEQLKSESIQ